MIQAVRYTLWASAPFNLLAAYMVLLPSSSLGRLVGMPPSPPLVYSALLATMIALFGLAYAWLATQPEIDRPLVGLAAIAKTMVFVIALLLWLADRGPGGLVLVACADLAFASLWGWWLLSPTESRRSR